MSDATEEWVIPQYAGSSLLTLRHPLHMNIEEIFIINGFTNKRNLINDIALDDIEFYDFVIYTKYCKETKQEIHIVDLSNSQGGVFLFYCSSPSELVKCIKDLSEIMYNTLASQNFFNTQNYFDKFIEEIRLLKEAIIEK